MITLVNHFEQYLGTMVGGWKTDIPTLEAPVQITKYELSNGQTSFATLGLSHTPLHSSVSGKEIHEELILTLNVGSADVSLLSVLEYVVSTVARSKHALLRGEVVGPLGPLVKNSPMEAFYTASPVYFPDAFATYSGGSFQTVIAWLVPIARNEADFVQKHGWRKFEDQLLKFDPLLTDLFREPLAI
ncbi:MULTISPECIES: suppressor of fused domain protein [Subtercola]|uniref:Suppressor of fused domain protein n=1 Tax=Subtercola vilae TaxID=2056433 RepID=A0A4T2C545_9MICO|nr:MULTISPECIES: suppressor of fused domain protein [Subtercola]MEA9984122.1 suppressor of fused domain protein [Subtercola sp. RTI3]TIH38662.1 suppressor of fused domain protein [Subtercola vilae]